MNGRHYFQFHLKTRIGLTESIQYIHSAIPRAKKKMLGVKND
jgi:hypothetical protein